MLQRLSSGKEIPENEPGVWTESDDWMVSLHDPVEGEGVVVKHGMARCFARRRFLAVKGLIMGWL